MNKLQRSLSVSPKEDKAYFTDLTNDDFGFQFYNTWYAAVFLNAKDIRRRINPNPNTDKDQLKMADVCRWRMEHSAYIEIQKSTADVSSIQKHKRMTFTGALSNLGNIQMPFQCNTKFLFIIRWSDWSLHWNEYVERI